MQNSLGYQIDNMGKALYLVKSTGEFLNMLRELINHQIIVAHVVNHYTKKLQACKYYIS